MARRRDATLAAQRAPMATEWLIGWKEIAKYLGRCVRTAKRYHYEVHMPVMRPQGMGVRALKGTLDIWIAEYSWRANKRH